jgi:hypothetical protein
MKKNRWFNWMIATVLIGLAALSARQFAATAQVVSANASQTGMATGTDETNNPFQCPFTPEQIRSIHTGNIQEYGSHIPVTKDGPMGVEGGLYILRYCKTP